MLLSTPTITKSQQVILESVRQDLRFAQRRLLDPTIPHELKTRSYIRICCSAIRTYREHRIPTVSIAGSKTPYLSLLEALAKRDVEWWKQCTVSNAGYLVSSDPVIKTLLSPLNQLVADHLAQLVA